MTLFGRHKAKTDNRNQFIEWLYDSYENLIYYVLGSYSGISASKGDIYHEVIVNLYPHMDYLSGLKHDDLTNYIIRATHNAAIDHIRNEKRHSKVLYIEDLDQGENIAFALDDRLLAIEDATLFYAAWKKLDERSQLILRMKFVRFHTDEEIAEAFHVAVISVRTMVLRARKKFIDIYNSQNQ